MTKNQFDLVGRKAMVTGASSGIGRAIATGMAAAGATVVLAARRVEKLESLRRLIEDEAGSALCVQMDVRDRASVVEAINQAERAIGTMDILVNNAGVGSPRHFLDTDDTHLDFTMGTNFTGAWIVAQEFARRLKEQDTAGNIINISSLLATGVKPNNTAYCSSKGAIQQLTKAMALDLAPLNIRVNALAPGWFVTELTDDFVGTPEGREYLKSTPAGRAGNVNEMIGPAIFLASEASSFVNGAVVPVDGAHGIALI
ncbi:MAG: SDR family oxidoreductase [Pseudomonadota bacterium]|nr:SDR family oxidoreductase [Pseudomonadota bacterium]